MASPQRNLTLRGVPARTVRANQAESGVDAVLHHLGVLAKAAVRLTGRFAIFCLLAMLAIGVIPIAMLTGGWGGLLWFIGAYRVASTIRRRRQRMSLPPVQHDRDKFGSTADSLRSAQS